MTFQKIKMDNGEEIRMTLNYRGLYELRNEKEEVYNNYMRVYNGGITSELDCTVVLYAAYLCANFVAEHSEKPMQYIDFLLGLPEDRSLLYSTVSKLMNPKKKEN